MRYKKYIKVAFGRAMRLFVFIFLGPVVVLYNCILRCCLAAEIRNLEGKEMEEKSHNRGVELWTNRMLELSPVEELDFKRNCSRAFIDQITFGSLLEITDFASRRQRFSLVPNYALHHVLFNSLFSYGLTKEENPQSEVDWRFSFKEMGDYKLFREFQWDVLEIVILKNGKLNIIDRTGKIHTPRCKTWPLAKAHVQVQLTLLAPGLARNHVHLVIPSVVACEVRKRLPEKSILRQLLEPHVRFTQFVNFQALRECFSQCAPKNVYDRMLRPWLHAHTAGMNFTAEMQKECEKHYTDGSAFVPKLNEDIPYQCFLKEYYQIFLNFVDELTPLLKSDYEILRSAIIEYLPGAARANMVDILAGLLWNSCVVYHCDHDSYFRQWAKRYGCWAISTPLVKPKKYDSDSEKENVETISDGKINHSFVSDSVGSNRDNNDAVIEIVPRNSQHDGSKLFSSIDVCRSKCFFRSFIKYNENCTVNMKLFDTKYDFTDPAATKASETFFTELKDLSSKLKQRGEAIVKGDEFLRSICY